jgi:hypothetical protein
MNRFSSIIRKKSFNLIKSDKEKKSDPEGIEKQAPALNESKGGLLNLAHTISSVFNGNTNQVCEEEHKDIDYTLINSKLVTNNKLYRPCGPFEKVSTTIIFTSKPISLKCLANNKYVSVDKISGELTVKQDKISESELFELQYLSSGLISIIAKANLKYVHVEDTDQLSVLVAKREKIYGTLEIFELYDLINGLIALRSMSNGNFVSCYSSLEESQIGTHLVASMKMIENHFQLFKIIENNSI